MMVIIIKIINENKKSKYSNMYQVIQTFNNASVAYYELHLKF